MNTFLLNVLLALAWVALTGQFSASNFAFGFALGYVLLWLAHRIVGPSTYFGRAGRLIAFMLFFIWQMTKANLEVAYKVLSPRYRLRPGIIAIPLDAQTDAEITLLANLITLTPGTLSLDVSNDRRVLYLHVMDLKDDMDQFRRLIKKGLEARLLEVLR